jgi:hypothetical protein
VTDDLLRFATELDQLPSKVVRQGRGATARGLDAAANQAQQRALAQWSTYGRGMSGSAGTIRARMSADRSQLAGWLLADGEGAFFQEHGAGHHPPQPVLGPAGEQAMGSFASEIGKVVEQAWDRL